MYQQFEGADERDYLMTVSLADVYIAGGMWAEDPARNHQDVRLSDIDFGVLRSLALTYGFLETPFDLDMECSLDAALWVTENFDIPLSTVEFDYTTREGKKEPDEVDKAGNRKKHRKKEQSHRGGFHGKAERGLFADDRGEKEKKKEESPVLTMDKVSMVGSKVQSILATIAPDSARDAMQFVAKVIETGVVQDMHLVKQLYLRDALPSSMTRFAVNVPKIDYQFGDRESNEMWNVQASSFSLDLLDEDNSVLDTVISIDCRHADDLSKTCNLKAPYSSLHARARDGPMVVDVGEPLGEDSDFLDFLLGGDHELTATQTQSAAGSECLEIIVDGDWMTLCGRNEGLNKELIVATHDIEVSDIIHFL